MRTLPAAWLGPLLLGAFLPGALPLAAAELKPRTVQAFEDYVRGTEQRLDSRHMFLWCEESEDRLRRARQGEVIVQPTGAQAEMKVPEGLVHDWIGCAFIPGTTLERTLSLVQDYDHHKNVYSPEVIDSRLLSHNGDDFKIYLRLLKKKVITVVLDTDHDVRYYSAGPTRSKSRSYSTRIVEVENAGKNSERKPPPGTGHGFLWKLNSYWRFEERDGGVYIECQAISLTRDVPAGLGWLIEPIIRNLPRESLANTLRATRSALTK